VISNDKKPKAPGGFGPFGALGKGKEVIWRFRLDLAAIDLGLDLPAELLHLRGGEVTQKLGRLRAFVLFGERQQIHGRHVETHGEALDRLDRDRGEAMLDARKVALGERGGVGELGEREALFMAQSANAGTNLESKRRGSRTSGHDVLMVLGNAAKRRPTGVLIAGERFFVSVRIIGRSPAAPIAQRHVATTRSKMHAFGRTRYEKRNGVGRVMSYQACP